MDNVNQFFYHNILSVFSSAVENAWLCWKTMLCQFVQNHIVLVFTDYILSSPVHLVACWAWLHEAWCGYMVQPLVCKKCSIGAVIAGI